MLKRSLAPLLLILSIGYISLSEGYAGVAGRGYSVQLMLWIAACFVMFFSPGLAASGWFSTAKSSVQQLLLILLACGLNGWVTFWIWFFAPSVGPYYAGAVAAICVLSLYLRQPVWTPALLRPLALALLTAALYTTIVSDHGGAETGQQLSQARYWPTTDNQIPRVFADRVMDGRDSLLPFIQGDWRSSDRPPLQTGLILNIYGVAKPEAKTTAYFCLGIIINTSWILALWVLLQTLRVPRQSIALTIITISMTGAIFVNSIYAWPKMLAATMSLACMASVLLSRHGREMVSYGCAGLFAGLAMISHGAALFGLAGLVIYLAAKRNLPRPTYGAVCILAAAFVYAPWAAYQHYFDPPGDRLVKWQFAGITQADNNESIAKILIQQYSKYSLTEVLSSKINNMRLYVGDPSYKLEKRYDVIPATTDLRTGSVRWISISRMGIAPFLLLVAIPLIFAKEFRASRAGNFILLNVVASSLIFTMTLYGGYPDSTAWLHTAPYSTLLLWTALMPLAARAFHRHILTTLAMINLVVFSWLWIIDVPALTALGPSSDTAPRGGTLAEFRAITILMLVALIGLAFRWAGRGGSTASRKADPK